MTWEEYLKDFWEPYQRGELGGESCLVAYYRTTFTDRHANSAWVDVGSCRQKHVFFCCPEPHLSARSTFAAVHDENVYPDGKFKYTTYEHPDKADQPCIQDYACAEGREHWPDYVRLPDGREGPRPFRNSAERRAYQKLTNIVERR